MIPLLLSILGHVMADFIFQSDNIADEKRRMCVKALFVHWLAVFVTLFILLLAYDFKVVFWYALWLSIIHITLDLFKALFEKVGSPARELFLFFIDQIMHLVVIVFFLPIFTFELNETFSKTMSSISKYAGIELSQLPVEKILLVAIIYIYVLFGGAVLMRKLINFIYRKEDGSLERIAGSSSVLKNVKTGKVIGIFERAIVLTFYITGNVASIAFVIAAKSLARFKNFAEKDFAEYYLIGTLASVLIAMIGGIILKCLGI
ncbi:MULTISPECIES: DUF3307 domain-containing protein [Kosmotoga]|uniref:DUF3307 domain-containing protein n=1 Tax=Kosmotoga olearia (strain ATCC BAA-1733 / DSM 21960 / TBF 19.5.1) TaxID=521045 RepID=C5CFF5_KOSOT|nr:MULTISPECIES: DUF3307 domain-containing protein [Kosmotoga]ACR80364.1 hypothetical protein Kole_1675 [Kosmotoga olearia TBF 19.5.1]OAA19982.1 hypothetical protein DU53_09190 [Kosmotoga sp. DU53]